MNRFLLFIFLFFGLTCSIHASHVMGGEITWVCKDGKYIFSLIFYRDCNGADVNTVSETIRVWNHPSTTSITLPFVSRSDISPTCKKVSGSPSPLTCGTGSSGGNGIGAIEKVTYRSAPITLEGMPPDQGWIFTYENFSRSAAITNLTDPSSYGITISAKMYAVPGTTKTDSSPIFLQEPYFVSCVGDPYVYNMNPVDPDLDSLSVTFGVPYNNFPNSVYSPPTNPIPVPFETGFAYNSPTPNNALSQGSVPANINPLSGELTFTSSMMGNFVVKIVVKSYRRGILIAEVEREMQLIVVSCNTTNNPPKIIPPFSGNTDFETTVNAGTLINFNLNSSDIELLQDGNPQQNHLTASGLLFGNGFSSSTDCAISPCATLSPPSLTTGIQGVNTNFNWQTSCAHLKGSDGYVFDTLPFNFVFRVQDDYCSVPKVKYATVTINLVNPGVIQAPSITCIQVDSSGNVVLNWKSVSDPSGSFVSYRIYSIEDGLLATVSDISTSTISLPPATKKTQYYLSVVSGCNGNTERYSDTLSNLFLEVKNPSDGTALLSWNKPGTHIPDGTYFYIYREYPKGTWSLIDSVSTQQSNYQDTIEICQSKLNYQIILPTNGCRFKSTIDGDNFKDILTPSLPVISSLSIDTSTNMYVLSWNVNPAEDTYGYVIYALNQNGFLSELDTVWGRYNTLFTYQSNLNDAALSFTVAAFDSCYTSTTPPTYQTSAKASIHSSVFLTADVNSCDKSVRLSWTPYVGWSKDAHYNIYQKVKEGSFILVGSTKDTNFHTLVNEGQEYFFCIKAISFDSSAFSFSNRIYVSGKAVTQAAFHYLQNATVSGKNIQLTHLVDASSNVKAIAFERMNQKGHFEELGRIPVLTDVVLFTDSLVDVQHFSYTYRSSIVDSCDELSTSSNTAETILLKSQKTETDMAVYLSWNAYQSWDGSVISYRLYRDTGTGFTGEPIATLPPTQMSYQDNLSELEFNGEVCYYIEAIEGSNLYDSPKTSLSNTTCALFEPLIYVPNSFTPEGLNPIFLPVISNVDRTNYKLMIFDRWGQIIFETTDYQTGWNGKLNGNGQLASTGTYVFMIKMNDGSGNEIVQRGFVTLIK
jgi:gliding motility-associated-like protein